MKNSTRWGASLQALRRIALATSISVPATGALAAALWFVPPRVSIGIGLFGLILFSIGRGLNRPLLVGVGGVIMFAGVLAWALRQ